ncbi:hypothetical protein JMUB7517_27380 [Staphylococcus aureus]
MKNGFYATYRSKNKGKDKRSINLSVFLNSLLADNHHLQVCLLYTSDAADEGLGVDLGGRRIIKKKRT